MSLAFVCTASGFFQYAGHWDNEAPKTVGRTPCRKQWRNSGVQFRSDRRRRLLEWRLQTTLGNLCDGRLEYYALPEDYTDKVMLTTHHVTRD